MKQFVQNKRLNSFTIIFVVIAVCVVTAGVFAFEKMKGKTRSQTIACTQEAKLCPDGSAVGRTGQNCEFAPCPSLIQTPVPSLLSCNGPGDTCPSGYTCIQKCGPPVVQMDSPPPGYYCEMNSLASKPRMCPICLASNTLISTPGGEVNVTNINVGMSVWSTDKRGNKVLSKVVTVSHTDAPKSHKVVHLVLKDGRDVWVSPDHPTILGARVGDLRIGEVYDGASILSIDLVPYWDKKTYDLLPNSETGEYWANGILLGSTLFKN